MKNTHTEFTPILLVSLIAIFTAGSAPTPAAPEGTDWPNYANDPGGMRYSPLDQVNRGNVSRLKVAWIYHTGDVSNGEGGGSKSGFENTPIVVDGSMYISTPFGRVVALDPETGVERWSYDPQVDTHAVYSEGLINRGVSSWLDHARDPEAACHRRIFISTIDARLIALDAVNGKPCTDFGKSGQVDLKQGVGETVDSYGGNSPVRIYEETSAPAIIDDLVIVGSGIGDNARVDMPSGVVGGGRPPPGGITM
jgi:quinoprotein glucose dehydrogenase